METRNLRRDTAHVYALTKCYDDKGNHPRYSDGYACAVAAYENGVTLAQARKLVIEGANQ